MNILFLTERSDNNVGVLNYHGLEMAVGEIAECKWAGSGWTLHKNGESVTDTVKRVMPDADWVVCPRETLIDVAHSSFKTCIMVTDLHGKWNWGLNTPMQFAETLNKAGYDIIFSRYREVHGCNCNPHLFQQVLGDKFKWLPWSMDKDYYYRFKGEPEYDVLFLGSVHPNKYPLRHSIITNLAEFCQKNKFNFHTSTGIGVPVWEAKIDQLEKKGYPVGMNYARLLGKSRVVIFGNSKFKYPLQKNFEVRAAGCLAMSNAPAGDEELGFKDGVDYVNIDTQSWQAKLLYYLQNWDEGEKIAERGRQLFLERHTHEVRARELVEVLNNAD